jgi:hypothetical protein
MAINEHRFSCRLNGGAADFRPSERSSTYPFQKFLLSVGAVIGVAAAVIFGDLLAGAILFVGFACAGLLWRHSEIPIFPFCVLYQWLFVGVGYFYLKITGVYPGFRYLGNLEAAIWYSLAGLLCITFGIRFALRDFQSDLKFTIGEYDIGRLFWVVLILFSINWMTEITAVQLRLVAFNIAQILQHVLVLKYLSLYLLLLAIVQQRRQYSLGILAFAYVLLPELISSMTKFKELFFLLTVVILSQWQPFSNNRFQRIRNRHILTFALAVVGFLVVVGLVWSGGMKQSWRTALLTGQVSGSPIAKIEAYGQHAVDSIQQFDPDHAGNTFASRLSSGVAYFSHVLRVVPDTVPHEDGELTWKAVEHVLMPRFFFPEKPDLGGDSWIVRKYAHLNVSGEESGTSIGMGYMAEFYIDFGFPAMLVPLFLYGLLVGALYRTLNRVSPSPQILAAVAAGLFLQHFLSYEGNFTKLLGGILQNFLILTVILAFLGDTVHRFLCAKNTSEERVGEPDVVADRANATEVRQR